MSSESAKHPYLNQYMKMFKTQWGEEWAKDKFGEGYEKMFDWIKLIKFVPGEG
jgi:hypothetical protein